MTRPYFPVAIFVAIVCFNASALAPTPVGSAFAYQGQLNQNGEPFSGSANLVFDLFSDETGGSSLGTVSIPNQAVSNGSFTAMLDFGTAPFVANEARWVQVTVNGVPLTPRQRLSPTPFSLATRGLSVDSAGNVGIGTSIPNARLTVDGNATVSGNITVGGQLTMGTVARSVSINPAAFDAQDSFYQFDRLPTGQPGLSGTSSGNTMSFYASVQLPHGATITGLVMNCFDNISQNISVTLYRVPNNPAGWTALGVAASTGQSSSWQTFSVPIPNVVVDNTTSSYMLFATWVVPGLYHNIRLGNVQVNYTVSSAAP